MGLIVTILLGAFIGWIASIVTKRDAQQNWLENIVVGVVGAFIGSIIGSLLSDGSVAGADLFIGFEFGDIFWAFIGALLLCLALNYFKSGRKTLR